MALLESFESGARHCLEELTMLGNAFRDTDDQRNFGLNSLLDTSSSQRGTVCSKLSVSKRSIRGVNNPS